MFATGGKKSDGADESNAFLVPRVAEKTGLAPLGSDSREGFSRSPASKSVCLKGNARRQEESKGWDIMSFWVNYRAVHVFRPRGAVDDIFNRNGERGFRSVKAFKRVGQISDEWEARFNAGGKFRKGLLAYPIPFAAVVITVLNEDFISRKDSADYDDGPVFAKFNIREAVIDVLIDATKAGHRMVLIGGSVNYKTFREFR